MVKGYQAPIAGPLFLAKKTLPEGSWQPGQFFIDMKTRQGSVTLKGVVNCHVLLMRK